MKMLSDNSDLFGGGKSVDKLPPSNEINLSTASQTDKLKEQAQQLRREAAELEVALREEARSKGLPEDVINKLVPLQSQTIEKKKTAVAVIDKEPEVNLSSDEIRSKLGYLLVGDPIKFTTDLQRVKGRGFIKLWDSAKVNTDYNVNTYQLTSRTNIDPIKLKLDEIGYDYKSFLGLAIIAGTISALASSQIGGQVGFLLGYLSALFPILIVGVGSIAPGLIGDVLLKIKLFTDENVKTKYATLNAGKFLVGYLVGLPVSRFDVGGSVNVPDFFQLKPTGKGELEDRKFFSKRKFTQEEISRISAVCLAGPVAECIFTDGEASGYAVGDVGLLQELTQSIEPALTPEQTQSFIRWSAVTAHSLLTTHKKQFEKLVEAFKEKKSIE
eukprot:CAMPEP_0196763622 /NCGR_PEP_ID=MMETSP1095-20130614/4436_1 /TAXON_ID=96789 ORGANISM="Chromulina nebulosa, Strain UTEXLB2642" /NCGR_SAMPLE_ID=MMETSP1095 /ASSEMBLY_ACC=CAM_ASM_000446 /LENGTH=384 /DNA_ID=CAMNT_0042117219 /DNA_START=38 /DNA_END=1189 /DNA_ORIENTATION=+